MLEGGGAGPRGIKGRKKWDNCNSIISKIYLKREKRLRHKQCTSPVVGQLWLQAHDGQYRLPAVSYVSFIGLMLRPLICRLSTAAFLL